VCTDLLVDSVHLLVQYLPLKYERDLMITDLMKHTCDNICEVCSEDLFGSHSCRLRDTLLYSRFWIRSGFVNLVDGITEVLTVLDIFYCDTV